MEASELRALQAPLKARYREDVRKVLPGHVLEIAANLTLHERPFWSLVDALEQRHSPLDVAVHVRLAVLNLAPLHRHAVHVVRQHRLHVVCIRLSPKARP